MEQTNDSNILITGATGLSGRMLVREFSRQGIPVRALVRNRAKAGMLEALQQVTVYEGDMLQPDTLKAALDGVDKALLISSAFEQMPATQQTFIDAAQEAGVKHVVKYSGADSGVGFNSQNFIAQKEHENIEDYLVYSGLDWTIIRPTQFMEMYLPGAVTGVQLASNSLSLPVGKGCLAPVAIDDVAKVCVQLLTEEGHEGNIYEMTGPDALTMEEVCHMITEITGRNITYVDLHPEVYRKALVDKGVEENRVRILSEIFKERRKCIASHIKLGTHQRFGIRPTGFAEFLYRNAAAFA